MQGVYNIETSDYRYMSREALIAAAEHNRQSAAYMNRLYQQEKQKNQELMETVAFLTSQIRKISEGNYVHPEAR